MADSGMTFDVPRNFDGDCQSDEKCVFIQFIDPNGEETGSPVVVPSRSSISVLTDILTSFVNKVDIHHDSIHCPICT